jgi:hypothetical protein
VRVIERVQNKWTADSNGCYVSWYSVGSHGYAQVGWYDGIRTINTLCHIVAWVAVNGPIPEGFTVDHTCRNQKCVNVSHMRLLTNLENARRNRGRDWPLGQCINGHPNSELRKFGQRWRCGVCKKQWDRQNKARRSKRGAALPIMR